MTDFEKISKTMEEESIRLSQASAFYKMDEVQTNTEKVFPWAPTTNIQQVGGSILKDQNLIDVDSELMNITRKLSKDPETHYKPSEETVPLMNLEDGFFHQESTLLSNPPKLLRGQTKNRWINLYKDPMENTIEPFDRMGENTYLGLMDREEKECATSN